MNRIAKNILVTLASITALLYFLFLTVPYFINLDVYKSEIRELFKESTKLNLEYSKIGLYSTPFLTVGVNLKDVVVTFDDNTELFKSKRLKGGIVLPSLLTLTLKTSKCYVDNPSVNLEIVNSKQYKLLSLVEEIINENIKNPKPAVEKTEQELKNERLIAKLTGLVRIKVPSIKISNYSINVVDSKTNHHINLVGKALKLGYISKSNTYKFKTNAKLLSDKKENIKANIDILAQLPKLPVIDNDVIDPEETVSLPFVNIVDIYQTYDFKTNVFAKLKIKNQNIYGSANIDNLTLKLSNMMIPESYLHTKFDGKKVDYDSNIFVKQNEKINLSGFLRYDKHPHLKAIINSDEIYFNDTLALLKGLLDSLSIKNDIASIKSKGYLFADASIDTDFKSLYSSGKIVIKDGEFLNKKTNIGIKNLCANLIFDDNSLNVKDTYALINDSSIDFKGYIDKSANTDLKLNIKKLAVPVLYNTFAPRELKRVYKLNNLNLTADLNINGKLNNLKTDFIAKLNDLSISDNKNTMFILNNDMNLSLNLDKDNMNAQILDNGFNFNIPSLKFYSGFNSAKIDINKNEITINPFDYKYNKNSNANIKGKIKDYKNNPDLDIFLDGKIAANDIIATLGKDVAYYFSAKGLIPFKVKINGNSNQKNVLAQIYFNSLNYVTPVHIKELKNLPTLAQANVKIKGNKITIDNSGIFRASNPSFSNNLELNKTAKQILEFKAIFENDHINLLKLNIPEEITGSLALLKNSSFKTKGKLVLRGKFNDINYFGNLKLHNISLPELKTTINSASLDFANKILSAKLDNINLNGSKLDTSLKVALNPVSVIKVFDVDIKSDSIDADKVLVVSDNLAKISPQSTNSQNNYIPLLLNGKFHIKNIKSGQIALENTNGNLKILNNNLIIEKLSTDVFEGKITGDIKMNLLTSLMNVKAKGRGLDADKMFVDAANMKDTISGNMDFGCDISLSGATYQEQIKSLKGNLDFKIKDGQYGPFAKLENFFLAENIQENMVFKNTIGAILSPVATIDSTHFSVLDGKLNFKDGIANIASITSKGDILCILLKGNLNLLTNEINSNVRVRLASAVSDLLGPLALANPINLAKNTSGLNLVSAKLFTFFTEVVNESEYKEIPDFAVNHSDNNATKFQIILNGDLNKPLKLVKSFKWLALQSDMDKADEITSNFIKEQEEFARKQLVEKLQKEYEDNNKVKVLVQKTMGMNTTAPEVKELIKDEILKSKENKLDKAKEAVDIRGQESKKKIEQAVQNKKLDTLNKVNSAIKNKIQSVIPKADEDDEDEYEL